MKYIPDKKLYAAVMFALKMCPSLQNASDANVRKAADYYRVNREDVFGIVREELWCRANNEAKKRNNWFTVFNPHATKLLDNGLGENFVFVCPRCGSRFRCNMHDDYRVNMLYISRCKCGFTDDDQRKTIRREFFNYISQKEN